MRWLVISGHDAVRPLAGHVVDWFRMLLERKPEMAHGMRLDRLVAAWDAGKDPVCRGAPHLLVAVAPASDPAAPIACTLALAYLELAAPSFGLGCCWAGYLHMAALHWPPLRAALALPEKHQLGGAMLAGEPRYRYHRLPLRRTRRSTWR